MSDQQEKWVKAPEEEAEHEGISLKGLAGVIVQVDLDAVDGRLAEVERDGLQGDELQREVELHLSLSQIPVFRENEARGRMDIALLYVGVGLCADLPPYYCFYIHVGCDQLVVLDRDLDKWGTIHIDAPSRLYSYSAELWGADRLGWVIRPQVGVLRQYMLDAVDVFIAAFLAVNPRE
jgi:hypothetical protein